MIPEWLPRAATIFMVAGSAITGLTYALAGMPRQAAYWFLAACLNAVASGK